MSNIHYKWETIKSLIFEKFNQRHKRLNRSMSGATLPVLYSYNMAALVAVAGFRVKLDSTTARVFEVAQA